MRLNIAGHRRRANSRMKASAMAWRPGETSTDPTSGEVTTARTLVYSGRSRWKAPQTSATEADAGTALVVTSPGEVHIPIDNPDGYTPLPGDIIECVANPDHPSLIGRQVTVSARFDGDDLTAYRIPIEGA